MKVGRRAVVVLFLFFGWGIENGGRGTDYVAIRIVIIVVFRSSTRVGLVAVEIIIKVVFGLVVIVNGNIMAAAGVPLVVVVVIFGVTFSCSIKLASGWGTFIVFGKIMVVAFEIIINVVFGFIIIIIVVIGEGPTLRPVGMIIIVNDKANGPIIRGNRVFGRVVVVTIIIIIKIVK